MQRLNKQVVSSATYDSVLTMDLQYKTASQVRPNSQQGYMRVRRIVSTHRDISVGEIP